MSIGKVVRHFEAIGKVPVDINDVLALVREICPDEKIRVRGVDIDPGRLKGNCYRYKIPPQTGSSLMPVQCSLIVYSTRMSTFEQRLVCCKELVHIVNPDPIVTRTSAEVVHLAERVTKKIILKPGQTTSNDIQVFLDHLAVWHAVAILVPFGIREELLAAKSIDQINLDAVAEALEIPRDYVKTALGPSWALMRETILAYN